MRHLRDEEERLRLSCGCAPQDSSDRIPVGVVLQYIFTLFLRAHRTEHASEAPARRRALHKGERKPSQSLEAERNEANRGGSKPPHSAYVHCVDVQLEFF